jgi:hypothetical protein
MRRKQNASTTTRLRKFLRRSVLACCVLAVVYAVVPALGAALQPGACDVWRNRYVPAGDLRGDDLVALRRETKLVRVPSYMAAWPRDGISLPGVVAVSDQRVLSGTDTLLWHEMVHQHQYRRDGAATFMLRYVADWHSGLLRGCGFTTSYESIGYEIETERILERMRVDLGGLYSHDFERIALMLEDPSLRIPRVRPRLYSNSPGSMPRPRPVPEAYELVPERDVTPPVPTSTPVDAPALLDVP